MNPTLVENLKAELTKTRGQLAELAILQKRERALINLLQEYDPQPLGTISSLQGVGIARSISLVLNARKGEMLKPTEIMAEMERYGFTSLGPNVLMQIYMECRRKTKRGEIIEQVIEGGFGVR